MEDDSILRVIEYAVKNTSCFWYDNIGEDEARDIAMDGYIYTMNTFTSTRGIDFNSLLYRNAVMRIKHKMVDLYRKSLTVLVENEVKTPPRILPEAELDLIKIKTSLTQDEWTLLYQYYVYGYSQPELAKLYKRKRSSITRAITNLIGKVRAELRRTKYKRYFTKTTENGKKTCRKRAKWQEYSNFRPLFDV